MNKEKAIQNLDIMLDSAQRRTRRDIVIPDLIEAIEMAIEALKEKPERKQEWIPCSEGLPPYSEKIVLATVVRRDKSWNNDPYHRLVTYSQGKWYPVPQSINLVPCRMATIDQSDGGQAEVIAWMPLPDPYREEASK